MVGVMFISNTLMFSKIHLQSYFDHAITRLITKSHGKQYCICDVSPVTPRSLAQFPENICTRSDSLEQIKHIYAQPDTTSWVYKVSRVERGGCKSVEKPAVRTVTGEVNYRWPLFCLNHEQRWQRWIAFTPVSLINDSQRRLEPDRESPPSTFSSEDTVWVNSHILTL